MSSSYLSITEEDYSGVTTPSGEGNAYINAMYVRFRSGPGSDTSILGEYNRGKSVTVTGTSGGWTACIIDGQSGYVYSDYISSGGSYTPSPAWITATAPRAGLSSAALTAAADIPSPSSRTITMRQRQLPNPHPMWSRIRLRVISAVTLSVSVPAPQAAIPSSIPLQLGHAALHHRYFR